MIGKMYRPLQVLTIPGKRGYEIFHKYKSNFGGTYEFLQKIYLYYQINKETEKLFIDMSDCKLPIIVEQYQFAEDPVIIDKGRKTEYEIPSDVVVELMDESPTIQSFRKLSRPTKISTKGSLEFTLLITSSKNPDENDMAVIEMMPIVNDGDEFMHISVICKTPVDVKSGKGRVIYENRS